MFNKTIVQIVATITLASLPAAAGDTPTRSKGVLGDLSRAEQIYGPTVRAKDVRGRVIFYEYWGIKCPPCRASFPRLVAMQKKYAPTGKFTVIASHVQRDVAGATLFCTEKKANFPVFQQLRLPQAPCGRGIPSAYLFDYRGRIVAKGHPDTLYSRVAALVRATPKPLSDMLDGVEVKLLRRQALRLVPGKAIASTFRSLERKATGKGPAAEEAAAIVAAVRAWIKQATDKAGKLADTTPTKAVASLAILVKTVKGLPQAEAPAAMLKALKADRNVTALIKIRTDIARHLRRYARRKGRSAARTSAKNLKKRIETLLKKEGVSDAVKSEADELLKKLD